MNNTFFNKEIFPDSFRDVVKNPNYSVLSFDESYLDSIRNNIGKQVCIFASFYNSNDFKDFKFNGIIEHSGKDYVVLSEPSTGKWHLIPSKYIDFITFDENINYSSSN